MASWEREHIVHVLTHSEDIKEIREAIWDMIVVKHDHNAIIAEIPPERRKTVMQLARPLLDKFKRGEELYPEDWEAMANLAP
ncbi:hypothetical protein [Methylobacterium oryzae]|uniref:hypothetical protein n=1 Tax=Methylobacterium oryzae TaxID=334852 RepID=UPI001F30174E|nr:hypothetical protein [Methylobacterium oryzae]UIN38399.1 hypothetical protein LXM90_30925 [Methylobacterium oryzae]